MKKTLLVLAALAAGVSSRAEDARKSYSVTTDFTYASEYVFRGVQNTRDAFQPSVEVTSGDFGVGVWTNQPVTRHENNEVDLYGNYTYKVSDALSLEGVTTYYWYPEASGGQTKDSVEVGVGGTYNLKGLSPSLYYYYDFVLKAQTVQAALGYSLPIADVGASLDFNVYGGNFSSRKLTPDAPFTGVHESYMYYGADVSIPYKLSTNAKVTAGVHYANTDNLTGVKKDRVWYTIGATVGF